MLKTSLMTEKRKSRSKNNKAHLRSAKVKLESAMLSATGAAAVLKEEVEGVAVEVVTALPLAAALVGFDVLAAIVLAALLVVAEHLVGLGNVAELRLLGGALGLGQVANLVRVQLKIDKKTKGSGERMLG